MMKTKSTEANKAANRQWTNRSCGALDGIDKCSLAYFGAIECNR